VKVRKAWGVYRLKKKRKMIRFHLEIA